MNILTKGAFFIGCLSLAACLTYGCASTTASSAPVILTIGTADRGGTMYPAGRAIAQVISNSDSRITVNVSASNGSPDNVRALMEGEIDLGLVSGDAAYAAVNGEDEFTGQPAKDLRVIAAVYPSLSNWLTLASSDAVFVHDLKEKQLGLGPQHSTSFLSGELALSLMGITEDNTVLNSCGLGSGTQELESGDLDAIHGFTGIPVNSFAGLAGKTPCRILRYTDQEIKNITQSNSFYYSDTIPAGTYDGQDEDIPTFGIKCLLCADADLDEQLVYELTSVLYHHTDELKKFHNAFGAMEQKEFLYSDLPAALHPGAEKFYREQGLLEE